MQNTNKPTYTVAECSVCAIDDYIGTAPSLCDLYYSPTNVQYNYGYQYKVARLDGCAHGYYVGTDRFYQTDGKWAKEYALYEYGVYDMQSTPQANEQMYSFLVQNAIQLGCSRILFPIEGGNDAFYDYFTSKGFVQNNGYIVLTLPKATLPAKDQVLLPQEGDVVSFRVQADGFLYNMVRIMVGTLAAVAAGRMTPEDVLHALQARDRALAGSTAPACGLYLDRVYY